MNAVWFERKGPAREVLVHGDMPRQSPGVGEVRVRLRVSGVNPTDTKTRGGWLGMTAMPFPRMITGQDGAGVIDRVGPGVPASREGERVWVYEAYLGRAFGTLAEFVVVPARNAVRLPDGIDDDTGAGLGVPALTAHRCLFIDGPIHGRTVLVQGGGGGVGHAAIQLARWAGAQVIATVSRPEQEKAAAAGRRASGRQSQDAEGGRGSAQGHRRARRRSHRGGGLRREHPGRRRHAGRRRRDRHLLRRPGAASRRCRSSR